MSPREEEGGRQRLAAVYRSKRVGFESNGSGEADVLSLR